MKSKPFFALIISFLLIGIYIMPFSNAHSYSVLIYVGNHSAIAKNPTFSLNDFSGNINLTMDCFSYLSGSGSTTCSFNAPPTTTKATSTRTTAGNCVNMGEYVYQNVQSSYDIESSYSLTSSTTTYQAKPLTILSLTTSQTNLTFTQNLTKDSFNQTKNLLSNSTIIIGNENLAGYLGMMMNSFVNASSCGNYQLQPSSQIEGYGWSCDGGGNNLNRTYTFIKMFVFNSSHAGILDYNVSIANVKCVVKSGGNCWSGYEIGYFQSGSTSRTTITTSQTSTGILNLVPNTIYVFYLGSWSKGRGDGIGVGSCSIGEGEYNTNFTINIGTPDWQCSEWSECLLGIKSRLCHDNNGFVNDYVNNEACYALPEKSINIGFEDSRNVDVFYSYPYLWWLPIIYCPYCVAYKTIEYPSDWNVWNVSNPQITNNATGCAEPATTTGYVYDDLKMTNEDSSNGIKSLKMWYLPPETAMVWCPNLLNDICIDGSTTELDGWGNTTIGYFPELQKDINESYMVSRDITFDYPNITITLDIKKCNEPEKQYSGNTSLLGSCGEGYYTHDKSIEWEVKPTNIFLNIYDYNTSKTIMNIKFISSLNKWQKYQARLINLTTTDLYRFSLNLFPNDYPIDSDVYCAYIDNINLNAYSGLISCESHCGIVSAGETISSYYKAEQTSDYGCSFSIEEVSPNCIGTEHELEIGNCISFPECDKTKPDYLTYYQGNNETGTCEWTITFNSTYAIDYCKSQSIKKPIIDVAEIGDKLLPFFSPIFIIVYIIIGIGAFLTYKLSKGKERVSWEIFAISLVIGFLIASIMWVEMAFIGICIMLVVIYFLAKEHGKPSG